MKAQSTSWAIVLVASVTLGLAGPAYGSHFRYGHITWEEVGPNTAAFTITAAFRRDGFLCRNPVSGVIVACSEQDGLPGIGDVFLETIGATRFNFGDGSALTPVLYFRVVGINHDENWLLARALDPSTAQATVTHKYTSSGPFVASISSCCRISGVEGSNRHINNPDGSYRIEAVVNFAINKGNPKSFLPPIVKCAAGTICTFSLLAVDPDNHRIRFRLANLSEAGIGFVQPGPPHAAHPAKIDSATGNYIWDTQGAILGSDGLNTLYSTQVIIEDLDSSGNPVSKSAVDFFIQLVPLEESLLKSMIAVPVRWCAAEGVVTNLDQEAKAALQCVNDNIFGRNETRLQFISPLGGTSLQSFPLIDKTFATISSKAGTPPNFYDALRACRKKWEERAPQVTGIVAVLIEEFDDPKVGGQGQVAVLLERENEAQRVVVQAEGPGVVVRKDQIVCNSPKIGPHRVAKTLGHELAHALSLHHGDGVDDDGDGALDEDSDSPGCNTKNFFGSRPNTGTPECPDGPSPHKGGENLMLYEMDALHPHIDSRRFVKSHSVELTTAQNERIRIQALLVPDRQTNPLMPPRGSSRVDELGDVDASEAFVDIRSSTVALPPHGETTTLAISVLGELPENISNLQYFFAGDFDGNPFTGGAPSTVGMASLGHGAELVAAITVHVNNGMREAIPAVWKFDASLGQFAPVVDPRIRAKILDLSLSLFLLEEDSDLPTAVPAGHMISVEIPSDIVGNINAVEFSLETIAHNTNTGTMDGAKSTMTFLVPTYPQCQVSPVSTVLGATVQLEADFLPPQTPFDVFLGEELVASGEADSTGAIGIEFRIPELTSTGTRHVTVGRQGTAATANCHLILQGPPRYDVPPTPAAGSMLTVRVGEELSFMIQVSDPDEEDEVTLGLLELLPGADFPIPGRGNPVESTFSWTPGMGQEGDYIVVFTASDNRGLSAPPHSLAIRVLPPILADLALSKTVAPNPVALESNLTYTITVRNNGPDGATNVRVTDQLPSGASLVSATPSQGACSGNTIVDCDLGTLASGSNATISVVVTARAGGSLTNTAQVSASETDPEMANNAASITATVTDFMIGASPGSATVNAGQTATYTLSVTPQHGPFGNAVNFACSGLPERAACSFNPASVTPGADPANTTLTITTMAAGAVPPVAWRPSPPAPLLPVAGLLGLALFFLLTGTRAVSPRRRAAVLTSTALLVFAAVFQLACASAEPAPRPQQPGTPPGTYTVTVTASSGSLQRTTTVTLTVR